jgi:hypothetical protein
MPHDQSIFLMMYTPNHYQHSFALWIRIRIEVKCCCTGTEFETNPDTKNSFSRFLTLIRESARIENFHTTLKGLFDEMDLAFDGIHGHL